MTAPRYHLVQANIARLIAPLANPRLADFIAQLDTVNALADGSPGFVWRFQGSEGNATYLRPYADESILFNMSVWETLEALKAYVYRGEHAVVLRRRREWFQPMEAPYQALWWTPAGALPTVAEAVARLDYLRTHGPTPSAFTFKQVYDPVWEAAQPWQASGAAPCPAYH
jgi:hypothetical protein